MRHLVVEVCLFSDDIRLSFSTCSSLSRPKQNDPRRSRNRNVGTFFLLQIFSTNKEEIEKRLLRYGKDSCNLNFLSIKWRKVVTSNEQQQRQRKNYSKKY